MILNTSKDFSVNYHLSVITISIKTEVMLAIHKIYTKVLKYILFALNEF